MCALIERAQKCYMSKEIKMNLIEMGEKENILESTREAPQPKNAPEEYEEEYERKFSVIQRFYRLFIVPSEAMKDIALEPEYRGVATVIFIELVLSILIVTISFQKIQLIGVFASLVSGMLNSILPIFVLIASLIASGLFAVTWVIESLVVKVICNSASEWDFGTAASVTGYAYVADIVVSILGIFVLWFLFPTITIDVSGLETAKQALANMQAQTGWLRLAYTIPASFGRLLWRSYLGSLGTHFGTEEKCSIRKGFAVFFLLGLIGFLISFLLLKIY